MTRGGIDTPKGGDAFASFHDSPAQRDALSQKPPISSRHGPRHNSCRPCENSATHSALPVFRGLRPRRAEKIAKIGSPSDHTEPRIEFSHSLLDFCTYVDKNRARPSMPAAAKVGMLRSRRSWWSTSEHEADEHEADETENQNRLRRRVPRDVGRHILGQSEKRAL